VISLGAGAPTTTDAKPNTKAGPAIDGAERVSKATETGPLREVSSDEPCFGILQPAFSSRQMLLVAAAISILIHAGVMAATLTSATHRVPRTDNQYVYVTLASSEPGLHSANEKYSVKSHRESDKAQLSRNRAHFPRAVRLARKTLARFRRQKLSPVSSPVPVKSITPTPVSAKTDLSGKAPILFKEEGTTASSQEGETHGEGLASGLSGTAVYEAPTLLSRVIPSYPENARRLGIEGRVVLRFVVDQSGRVEREIEVVTSIPMLDQAAINAVRQWRFSPARDRDGNPVRVLVSVPLQFTLQ
jgi:periplasmic protein TonB